MKTLRLKIVKYVFLTILVTTGCANLISAQENTVLDVFNDQVDAFIKEDVGRLVNNVSDDFKYFYISSDELVLEVEGKDQFEKSMRAYFGRGRKVFSKIESYFIDKNRITFKEIVSHKNKNGETVSSSAIGTYEIKNGKITRSWYFVD